MRTLEFSAGLPLDLFALVEAPSRQGLEPAALADPGLAGGQSVVPFIEALRDLQALVENGQSLPGAGKTLPVSGEWPAAGRLWPAAQSPAQAAAQIQSAAPLPDAANAAAVPTAEDFTLSANRVLERLADATAADAEIPLTPPTAPPRNSAAPHDPQKLASEALALEDDLAGVVSPQALAPSRDRLAEAEGRRIQPTVHATQALPAAAAADRLPALQPTPDLMAAEAVFESPDVAAEPRDNARAPQFTAQLVPPVAGSTIDPGAAGLLAPAPVPALGAAAPVVALPPMLAADASALPAKAEELAGQIRWMVDQKLGEAKLRLHPPELGSVEIKISLVDDRAHVQIVAHNSGARDLLEQNLPRLRELLAMGGMDLGGASVSGGRGEQSASQQTADTAFEGAFAADVDIVAERVALAAPDADGLIDLYA
jgi:flagellar hook-length control protein FliK